MASSSNQPIPSAPAPWTLHGTVYIFMMYTLSSDAAQLSLHPEFLYSPLEAASEFSRASLVGGLSMVQLIRYSESPVGPYDEMVMIPGHFRYGSEGRSNLRCSRVFVSQENTRWNGRKNWNIPKHLADFEFKKLPNGQTQIRVYPLLPDAAGVERLRPITPFFTTTFKPLRYLPAFPASTDWAKYLGMDLALVQPPLPHAPAELPGTDQWCKVAAVESSKVTRLGWFDMRQPLGEESEQDPLLAENRDESNAISHSPWENFWPGFGRWRLGIKMENAVIDFPAGEHWKE